MFVNKEKSIQNLNYYPSGVLWSTSTNQGLQPYKYGEKELIEISGLDMYDNLARYYEPAIGRANSIDPLCEKYYSVSPYAWCGNNFVNVVDPTGMDVYRTDDSTGVVWIDGSEEREGYTNIGKTFTVVYDEGEEDDRSYSVTYEQNQCVSTEEIILTEEQWETQRAVGNKNKPGEEGNCFYQAGKMVMKTGTISDNDRNNNLTDIKEGINYINNQIDNGYAVRVNVDRTNDGKGDHWVTISSRITNLVTGETRFGFFDPGTINASLGTNNSLYIGKNGVLKGRPSYNKNFLYKVVKVRKNIKK